MKKRLVIFTILLLVMFIFVGTFGYNMIFKMYKSENETLFHLAGKLMDAYPDVEITFVEAISDREKSDADDGARILARYGYHEDSKMILDETYRDILKTFRWNFFLFAIASAVLGYGFLIFTYKRQKEQEKNLLFFFDQCLSGNDIAKSEEMALTLKQLQNPLLEDALKRLGESLRLKTEYLEKEHDCTKTLVTDISHQLKTPVSALKTCFTLCAEAEDETEREEFFDKCRVQMDKLEMLVGSLLSISRLETGIIDLQREKVLLSEILVEAVNSVYLKISARNMEIITEDFTDLPLNLDRKWTAEAIANVLDNAVKYGYEGNCIRIHVNKLYSFVRVEIEDEGIGIPKEEQTKVFQRFYRGKNEIVKNTEGSGVGLYLSRQILERQGGTISVHSAHERGCVFVIQLPL